MKNIARKAIKLIKEDKPLPLDLMSKLDEAGYLIDELEASVNRTEELDEVEYGYCY